MHKGLIAGLLVCACAGSAGAEGKRERLLRDLCGGDEALLRMDAPLLAARAETLKGTRSADALARHAPHARRGGMLQVIIASDDPSATVAACKAAGLEIVNVLDAYGMRTVTVRCGSAAELDVVARDPATRRIAPEPEAVTFAGSVAGQGDEALNGPAARANYSVDGSGVRVGILSDSIFDSRGGTPPGTYPGAHTGSTDQGTGDLPATVHVIDPGFGGGTDEGNAMAQIVHDIAPGAAISFASATTSYAAFATNIGLLRTDATNPADVLVDDVLYLVEPIYQDGPIALAYRDAFNAGVPCFSSAGNNAAGAFEGSYVDANSGIDDGAAVPSGDDLHDFGGGDTHLEVSIPVGATIRAALHWSEPYGGTFGAGPGAESDLDLYLVSDTVLPVTAPSLLAVSAGVQGTPGSPFGDPVETITWQNISGSPVSAHLIVEHVDGSDPARIHLWVENDHVVDTALVGDRTLFGHATSSGAMAVGAVFFCEVTGDGVIPPGDFAPTAAPFIDRSDFTALGGTLDFFFDEFGAPASFSRFKPEVAAPNGVNTTFFGQPGPGFTGNCGEDDSVPNFFGTSASAPHAAAGAALLIERAADLGHSFTPSDLYAAFESTALDIDAVGIDNWTGHGAIDLDAAILGAGLPVRLDSYGVE